MMKPKEVAVPTEDPVNKTPLGESPAVLTKRYVAKVNSWCPKPEVYNPEYDSYSDEKNPKNIYYEDVVAAAAAIKNDIPTTQLLKSRRCAEFHMELSYKLETTHKTGSFLERGALYCLLNLTEEQKQYGVITASMGNWAMALAYHGNRLKIPVTVVMPVETSFSVVDKCHEYEAVVILYGRNLAEAKRHAFYIISESGSVYLNSYDHPNSIAGAGTIGLEILKQQPETDAIIVPVGGGGLLAGIATAVKKKKPQILVYGVEPDKSCCFFKALENEIPYATAVTRGLAKSLEVPIAGYNAFYTAQSLVDKVILVDDDCIAKAVTHLLEHEMMVVEGAGVTGLSGLMTLPKTTPELAEKNVVCVITGGNLDLGVLPRVVDRAKAVDGRLIKIVVTLKAPRIREKSKIFNVIASVGCHIRESSLEHSWSDDCDFYDILTLVCEARDATQAASLRRIMEKLFPNMCEFLDEQFLYNAYPACPCYTKVLAFKPTNSKMSRKNEDYDEFCDPDRPRLIKMEDVTSAADRIREHVNYTPCVASHWQEQFVIHLYYKEELLQKTGSFKERGMLNALLLLPADKKKIGVVIASLGNEAISFSYYASKMNVPLYVVMPPYVAIMKQQRCHALGAKVILQGATLMDSQRYARAIARDKGLTYINSRDHPHILAGYGTIGLEILEQVPYVDAVIIPVGQGGLVAAVATVIKFLKPHCLIYGVQTEAMAPLFESLKVQSSVVVNTQQTMADAIAVHSTGANSLHNAIPLVDKMLLVKEDWIARAMLHLIEKEKLIVEGAGACPLAAILGNIVPELKTKHVVSILSGGNVDSLTLNRCIDRGLAADYRLVKFTVSIKNTPFSNAQLLKLIAAGGYSVVRQFRDNSWVDDETYTIEVKLVCETKGLEHSLELKRVIERAYPGAATFETEPFNDKRTCPCYVRKIRNII
ncbi:uncharacterized protein LOC128677320 [Plodia interpunctella]|uniref:uncharacterized protein LOC128677320 n=1 Tax=Plodia interpunctella TaxID=58824 RepID=UPI0023675696|nr:uncharacterized protein LOC128677320 [Plodia interpunctella]